MTRFGIVANRKRPGADQVIRRVMDWVERNGHDCFVSERLQDLAGSQQRIVAKTDLATSCDYVISMGGDGTLLSAARAIGAAGVPIVGINLGALGFLTQVFADEAESCLEAIVAGKHTIQRRMILRATVSGREEPNGWFALNDVVVDRGSVARLIQLDLYVNDEFICTYRADGLIISTPTGSTAYNAAVGGPILDPNLEAIVASPIAPQSLAARPLLFHGKDHIRITISSEKHPAVMTIDGQVSVEVSNKDDVLIQRASHFTNLITFPHNSFYEILRNKLHWGVLPRAQSE
jgi:NAD+ kinase